MPRHVWYLSVVLLLVAHLGGAFVVLGDACCMGEDGDDDCPSSVACDCCPHPCPVPSASLHSCVEWRTGVPQTAPEAMKGDPLEVLHVPRT